MSGLNDFLTGTTAKTTTLPEWYDTAQQNLVNQATTAAGSMPLLENTVAGTAIQNLSGQQNPFMTAQNQLSQIGAGAANPWIVDQTTGQVTPNTATALGGLFQAQNQQLQQTLPTQIAPAQAAAIVQAISAACADRQLWIRQKQMPCLIYTPNKWLPRCNRNRQARRRLRHSETLALRVRLQ